MSCGSFQGLVGERTSSVMSKASISRENSSISCDRLSMMPALSSKARKSARSFWVRPKAGGDCQIFLGIPFQIRKANPDLRKIVLIENKSLTIKTAFIYEAVFII